MKFIRWCGLFVIGHPVIDSQHQELFHIINQFHEEVTRGNPDQLAVDTLNNLIKFAQKHFADEQNISKEFGYPEEELVRHEKIHEQLVMDIFDLHNDLVSGEIKDLDSISDFLTQWIILHILVEDNQYKLFLPKK